MNYYAVKNSLQATVTCYQEKLIPISFKDAKLEMKHKLKLFTYLSMTGLRHIDNMIASDIELATKANSWKGYFLALTRAIGKCERFAEMLRAHGEEGLRDERIYSSVLLYVQGDAL